MSPRALLRAVALTSLLARPALGETPADLFACDFQCYEAEPYAAMLACGFQRWNIVLGRAWWGPLQCVGPIQIAIQARSLPPYEVTLPLYVEIRTDPEAGRCESFPGGSLLWQTLGTSSCDPDSMWVTSPLIDLPSQDDDLLGRQYWIQLVGFRELLPGGQLGASPFVRCIRVTAYPVSVEAATWSRVKRLYK